MQEAQVIYWRTPPFDLPKSNSISYIRPVWMHSPEFLDVHGDGWSVVNIAITGSHESGDLIMAATMTRDITTDD